MTYRYSITILSLDQSLCLPSSPDIQKHFGWISIEKRALREYPGGGLAANIVGAANWRAEDKEAHEKMGFHEGWGTVAGQLEEYLKRS